MLGEKGKKGEGTKEESERLYERRPLREDEDGNITTVTVGNKEKTDAVCIFFSSKRELP